MTIETAENTIPELNKENKYPAQGAYVGHLLTDFLYSRLTSTVTDVTMDDGCLCYTVMMHQHDDNQEVVDYLPLAVTFHRGTIALLCESEEWWEALGQSVLFERLWTIAEHTGCLVALSATETNAANVWDPELVEQLEGEWVFEGPATIQ